MTRQQREENIKRNKELLGEILDEEGTPDPDVESNAGKHSNKASGSSKETKYKKRKEGKIKRNTKLLNQILGNDSKLLEEIEENKKRKDKHGKNAMEVSPPKTVNHK
jgi:hypothetical protein